MIWQTRPLCSVTWYNFLIIFLQSNLLFAVFFTIHWLFSSSSVVQNCYIKPYQCLTESKVLQYFGWLVGWLVGFTAYGNERLLRILQTSSINGTSPLDCLVSCPRHSLVGGLTPLQRSSQGLIQSQPMGQEKYNYLYSTYNRV